MPGRWCHRQHPTTSHPVQYGMPCIAFPHSCSCCFLPLLLQLLLAAPCSTGPHCQPVLTPVPSAGPHSRDFAFAARLWSPSPAPRRHTHTQCFTTALPLTCSNATAHQYSKHEGTGFAVQVSACRGGVWGNTRGRRGEPSAHVNKQRKSTAIAAQTRNLGSSLWHPLLLYHSQPCIACHYNCRTQEAAGDTPWPIRSARWSEPHFPAAGPSAETLSRTPCCLPPPQCSQP